MNKKRLIDAALLELAIDASNDGITIAEQEGDDNILIYVNPAFERLTGYHADDILYQDCRFLQKGDRDQEGLKEIREAIKDGKPCRTVVRNYKRDGTLFWNELSITPVYNEQDKLTYYIGIQKDVTDRVVAEQQRDEALRELEELRKSGS
ncbi:MAG: PAS domain-containing protein [Thioalkalivibrio sp.]